jgi:hypothetical protein
MSALGKVFAQDNDTYYINQDHPAPFQDKLDKMSKTEKTFSDITNEVRIRDYVYLKEGKMILELDKGTDYQFLKNLNSILMQFRKDVAFYKDSLGDNTGGVKIDYVVDAGHNYRQVRFKKHNPNGNSFVIKDNEVSKLKIEDDTVRILLHVKDPEINTAVRMSAAKRKKYNGQTLEPGRTISSLGDTTKKMLVKYTPQKTLIITFCLDNYYDIDKIIADSVVINHTIDTLATVAQHTTAPFYTIGYAPGETKDIRYNTFWKYRKVNFRANEKDLAKSGDQLIINGGVGAGLVKNTLAPMGEIGIEIDKRWRGNPTGGNDFIRLSTTPYFFFDKSAQNTTVVNDNWFVNLEFGYYNAKGKNRFSMGAGYLYAEKGDVFQKQTYKAFVNMQMGRVTVAPEFICNNNFKQIYPGITLKLLNIGN